MTKTSVCVCVLTCVCMCVHVCVDHIKHNMAISIAMNFDLNQLSKIKVIYTLQILIVFNSCCCCIIHLSTCVATSHWKCIITSFYFPLKPYSKGNHTNKLTKMRAIPQRKQHFPVSTTHKSTHYWHCSIHLSALVDSYRFIFRGWIWTLMHQFKRVSAGW